MCTRIAVSENGWTDQDIAVNYLSRFNEQTEEKAGGRIRILLLDGHSSHDSLRLVDSAREKNIKILAYPSHTTHILQGLDVTCFAQLKKKFAEKIHKFKENSNLTLTHKYFLRTFGPAFLEAFTPKTVRTAFSVTRIYPFRRDVVSSEKMGPSEALSTNPPIPRTLATPVRKVISAFSYHRSPPLADEQTGEELTSSQAFANDMTPTKRARILHTSLGTSSSTSFLVSEVPLPASSIRIDEPRFEKPPALSELGFSADSDSEADMSKEQIRDKNKRLRQKLKDAQKHIQIRDQVIEANHAEIVVQNFTNHQLRASLFQKEESRKRKNPALDFAGGRHITSDESQAKLKRLKDEREAKEREKRERVTAHTVKQEKKAIEGEKWDRANDRHKARLLKWKREYDALHRGEAQPPKPHCRRKAEVTKGESSSYESSRDESEEGIDIELSSSESNDEDV